jgi:hypothetical protein
VSRNKAALTTVLSRTPSLGCRLVPGNWKHGLEGAVIAGAPPRGLAHRERLTMAAFRRLRRFDTYAALADSEDGVEPL